MSSDNGITLSAVVGPAAVSIGLTVGQLDGTVTFIAYAYEALGGDEIDGRTVNRVDDHDDEVTVVFTSGPGMRVTREHEIRVVRDRDRT